LVVLAAAVTAAGMHYAMSSDEGSAVVFGVLIAATDPVSVIATFNKARVQGRLRLLIEAGESVERWHRSGGLRCGAQCVGGRSLDALSIIGALIGSSVGGMSIGGVAAIWECSWKGSCCREYSGRAQNLPLI
jgi:CPA1 family monovalent cation:H+ antiporter